MGNEAAPKKGLPWGTGIAATGIAGASLISEAVSHHSDAKLVALSLIPAVALRLMNSRGKAYTLLAGSAASAATENVFPYFLAGIVALSLGVGQHEAKHGKREKYDDGEIH